TYSKKEIICDKKIALLTIVSLGVCLGKIAYIFIPLLFFILPKEIFSSRNRYICVLLLVVIIPILCGAAWGAMSANKIIADPVGNNVTKIMLSGGSNFQNQLEIFIGNPGIFLSKLLLSWILIGNQLAVQTFAHLGLLDIPLPVLFFVAAYCVLLLFDGETLQLNRRTKIFVASIFTAIFLLIHLLLYLTYNTPDIPYIMGVQGRYFIPILPLLLIALKKSTLQISDRLRLLKISAIILISLSSLTYSVFAILAHDYGL
ncbi:MAG: DUF2142 domain-containing protein, partial [Pseudomonadota bacterium]